MGKFLKNYTLSSIKIKLIIIYLLNVTDIFFTLILINSGYFYEGNSIISPLVTKPFEAILLKLTLPGALILILNHRIKKATTSQLSLSNLAIDGCMIMYLIINCFHIAWLTLLHFYLH
ncbi:DUF5658 family protein [Clostridium manihotivorum]|uniref:DUF5658 domain-containing protein n=1 Tax=Clostridium manihotivorum TaxID=2320868 RepID=A0A3R5U6P2_9CLOT|nr:hypothetical protein C1I91_17420 [Clostridium manihotivorum]